MDKYFYRDFQLASRDATLEFSQYTIGDVGCVVWDAALVLAGYFDRLSKSRSFENANILELGSGTGCVGLVLAALGYVVSFYSFIINRRSVSSNCTLVSEPSGGIPCSQICPK